MAKRYRFDQKSNVVCGLKICDRKISANMVDRKHPDNAVVCNQCFKKLKIAGYSTKSIIKSRGYPRKKKPRT